MKGTFFVARVSIGLRLRLTIKNGTKGMYQNQKTGGIVFVSPLRQSTPAMLAMIFANSILTVYIGQN